MLKSVISPIGSFQDKLIVGLMSIAIKFKSIDEITISKEMSTLSSLSNVGLSDAMIDRFFTPFYQGIFLSGLQSQSSRMFEFVFKMFTSGYATLPNRGMGSIMLQLKSSIPSEAFKLNTLVTSITDGKVTTRSQSGEAVTYQAQHIVVATEAPAAQRLLQSAAPCSITAPAARKSTCVYFGIEGPPPILAPVLILNGENKLPQASFDVPGLVALEDVRINNVCFPSQVNPAYAPAGRSLASVTVLGDVEHRGDAELVEAVREQLAGWWGEATRSWAFLRVYRVPYAQPAQTVPYESFQALQSRVAPGVYVCGDHRASATLNGAMESGRRAAAAVLQDSRSSGV